MNVISLDNIVKNILLKRRYSLHWYLDFLVPAKDCLRELSFDLPIISLRYKVLTLNSNNALTLPDDYQDWAKVSVMSGQYLHPLIEDNGLSLVPNYDSDFNIQPFSSGIAIDSNNPQSYYNGWLTPMWFMVNWNAFGENIGRQFGGICNYSYTFKVNKARNEIKINESLASAYSNYVLEYVGNGIDADSATHIDAYCQAAIEAYAMWMFKENNRTYSPGETNMAQMEYDKQYRILRARFSDLSIDKLKRIVQKNSIGVKY